MSRLWVALACPLLLASSSLHAAPPDDKVRQEVANAKSIGDWLCGAVGDGEETDFDSENLYVHQDIILSLADVREGDSEQQIRQKVAAAWSEKVSRVYCENFDFKGGSLIRYAIHKRSDAFVDDVLKVWRVSPAYLNERDPKDGRTVLDYVADEIASTSWSWPIIRKKLHSYADQLVAAGAKHGVDIDGVECRQEGGFKPAKQC